MLSCWSANSHGKSSRILFSHSILLPCFTQACGQLLVCLPPKQRCIRKVHAAAQHYLDSKCRTDCFLACAIVSVVLWYGSSWRETRLSKPPATPCLLHYLSFHHKDRGAFSQLGSNSLWLTQRTTLSFMLHHWGFGVIKMNAKWKECIMSYIVHVSHTHSSILYTHGWRVLNRDLWGIHPTQSVHSTTYKRVLHRSSDFFACA